MSGTAVVSPYDDAASRTRLAWLRTALGAVALTFLLVRGLVVDGAPAWLALVAVLPGALLLAYAVVRMRRSRRGAPRVRLFAGAVGAAALIGAVAAVWRP